MAHYVIGDVQGCYDALMALIKKIHFNPDKDCLWFTGDLVNRGPKSAEVLRFVRSLGDRAVTVLGNHDLHLLAVAAGAATRRRKDTFDDVLTADDGPELCQWLRTRPFMHHDPASGYTLIHAGLLPDWNFALAQSLANEAAAVLTGPESDQFLANMYGDHPERWDQLLTGAERWRVIVNSFTRLRYCDPEGRMGLSYKGPPGSQPPPFQPWFDVTGHHHRGMRIIFGHWSTLGLFSREDILALDTGCLWGGHLTAACVSVSPIVFIQEACDVAQHPAGY